MSANPNISWDIICDNPGYDWSYLHFLENPNITMDIINQNRDKINNAYFFISKFTYNQGVYDKHIKRYVTNSMFIIQDLSKPITDYI